MKKKKPKILFLLRLPPRLTGATLMNSFVNESEVLHENFRIKTIPLPHSKTHKSVGGLSIEKLFEIFLKLNQLFFTLLFYRPRFVYFQMSPLGGAFIRDVLFVFTIKLTGTKIVHHLHGKGIDMERKKPGFQRLFRYAFKRTEVICLSKSLTSDLSAVYKGKPHIVPNVIKVDLPKEQKYQMNGKLNILYVSNLFVAKGIYTFIDALDELKNKNVLFSAHIVGNESEVTALQLQEKIKTSSLDSAEVEYLGPKYNKEKWDEYKWANVLVFPTHNDIWGLVLLEAMQASIPVIASRDGAIPEIVDDGTTGFLTNIGDVETIANRLEYLFRNPNKAEEMGIAGRKYFMENYSYEKFEQNMLETFNSIL